ncbi:class I SAM-dependent methyltransferase [Mangrovibacter phragmitis]
MGDMCHFFQLQNSMFELIIDGSCLHCLVNEARPRCFSEVRRLLTPAGRFVRQTLSPVMGYSVKLFLLDR